MSLHSVTTQKDITIIFTLAIVHHSRSPTWSSVFGDGWGTLYSFVCGYTSILISIIYPDLQFGVSALS
jgi:hypothetical protein